LNYKFWLVHFWDLLKCSQNWSRMISRGRQKNLFIKIFPQLKQKKALWVQKVSQPKWDLQCLYYLIG
jgi:hypothetical protein